jgi:uncharacterized protein YndB with AHSA1/START domain
LHLKTLEQREEPLMSEDRIERETLIAASLERVWELVTAPGFWVDEEAGRDGATAREGESSVVSNPQFGSFPVQVLEVRPQTYVSYRWASAFPGEDLREGNSTLVEFTLTPEGEGTRLRVVESGFAALTAPAEVRGRAKKDNESGWPEVLEGFRKRAEQAA